MQVFNSPCTSSCMYLYVPGAGYAGIQLTLYIFLYVPVCTWGWICRYSTHPVHLPVCTCMYLGLDMQVFNAPCTSSCMYLYVPGAGYAGIQRTLYIFLYVPVCTWGW